MVPAAVALLSGDHLFLETALLTESLWMFLIAAGLCAAMYSHGADHVHRWLIAAGVLLALAALVRHLALPLAIAVAAWAMWDSDGRWIARARVALAVLVPVILLVGSYALLARAEGGYAGFTDMSGSQSVCTCWSVCRLPQQVHSAQGYGGPMRIDVA